MAKIYRFQKDTIRQQCWETSIIFFDDKVLKSEIHYRKDDGQVIKQVEADISDINAQKYIEKNQQFLIEVYTN